MLFGKDEKTKNSPITMDDDKTLQKEAHPSKRRKPQDRSKLTRNSQVQIRLTEEEVATLKKAARENNMTLADFVMSGVSQTRRIVVPGAGDLRAEIIRVGNNLNQALRLAYIMRKEGKVIDVVSIEISADRAEEVLDKLQNWLNKWGADLTYLSKKGEK